MADARLQDPSQWRTQQNSVGNRGELGGNKVRFTEILSKPVFWESQILNLVSII